MGIALKSRRRSATVGLDIQAEAIVAAEVADDGSGIRRSAITNLPTGLVREGEILDADGLSSVIKEFMSENKLNRRVRLGVANQRVSVRVIDVPSLDDKSELDAAVRFKAGEHLPIPIEEAVIDYQVMKRLNVSGNGDGDGGESQLQVILVAAPKEMIECILAVVGKAGLKLEGIDLSAFALIRALYNAGSESGAAADKEPDVAESPSDEEASGSVDEAIGYCHLGAVTNLAVAHATTCLFARTMSYGVDSMAEEMSSRKDISVTDARMWLKGVGLSKDMADMDCDQDFAREARDVLSNGVAHLANELQDSLDFYTSQPDVRTITRTLITGPGVEIDGLVSAVNDRTPVSVEVASPKLDQSTDIPPALLSLAYGLAVDEVVA